MKTSNLFLLCLICIALFVAGIPIGNYNKDLNSDGYSYMANELNICEIELSVCKTMRWEDKKAYNAELGKSIFNLERPEEGEYFTCNLSMTSECPPGSGKTWEDYKTIFVNHSGGEEIMLLN